ncbi:MAG: CDP-alcohol phosphatidyltransferase family protein [Chloracidobacterium sp.]|nr:CDP-alcohol phosphatidyltransferase family protein [Chloracidobacterium sp.]MCC6824566.1 CDP-alcohol phosphatidyltransferase family protein [Acidobacteriota bacterium]MCO5333698.1 CDP-alcohol phosphatidyltransferase family protein [Pyrinomonadaceae bacterium]
MNSVLTFANILTFLRIVLVPIFAMLMVYRHYDWALAAFAVAGISDGIDGFVARHFKQESELGTVIDPIADKLLMTTAFIILSVPGVFDSPPPRHLPVEPYVTITVIARDILIVAVAGAINIMTGFRGFKPSKLGKASTFVQVLGVLLIMIDVVFPQLGGFYLPTVYITVAFFAAASGVHYIFHVMKLMREADHEQV